MKRNSGFTLAEILVAISISLLVTASILTVVMMSNRTWRESSASVTLQSNGRLILNQIARGSHGMYGLREANYNTLAVGDDGNSVTFSVDMNEPPTYVTDDDTGCRFYLNDERVWYDPNTAIERNEYPLVNQGRVESIVFTKNGSYVTIDLTMKDYATPNSDAYAKYSTNVFLRKARETLY